MKKWLREYLPLIILLFVIAYLSTLNFNAMVNLRVSSENLETSHKLHNDWEKYHNAYLKGDIGSPYKYRILVPMVIEQAKNFTDISLRSLYNYYHLIMLFALLVLFFAFQRIWLSKLTAFVGTLLFSAYLTGPFQAGHIEDAFVLFVFVFSFFLLSRKPNIFNDVLVLLLILVATFAKEITFFIFLAFALFKLKEFKENRQISKIFLILIAFLCFILPFLLLRSYIGQGSYIFTLFLNLSIKNLFYMAIFYNVILLFALRKFRSVPFQLKILMIINIPYFVLILFLGRLDEFRVLLPTLIPLIPAFLLCFVNKAKTYKSKS